MCVCVFSGHTPHIVHTDSLCVRENIIFWVPNWSTAGGVKAIRRERTQKLY